MSDFNKLVESLYSIGYKNPEGLSLISKLYSIKPVTGVDSLVELASNKNFLDSLTQEDIALIYVHCKDLSFIKKVVFDWSALKKESVFELGEFILLELVKNFLSSDLKNKKDDLNPKSSIFFGFELRDILDCIDSFEVDEKITNSAMQDLIDLGINQSILILIAFSTSQRELIDLILKSSNEDLSFIEEDLSRIVNSELFNEDLFRKLIKRNADFSYEMLDAYIKGDEKLLHLFKQESVSLDLIDKWKVVDKIIHYLKLDYYRKSVLDFIGDGNLSLLSSAQISKLLMVSCYDDKIKNPIDFFRAIISEVDDVKKLYPFIESTSLLVSEFDNSGITRLNAVNQLHFLQVLKLIWIKFSDDLDLHYSQLVNSCVEGNGEYFEEDIKKFFRDCEFEGHYSDINEVIIKNGLDWVRGINLISPKFKEYTAYNISGSEYILKDEVNINQFIASNISGYILGDNSAQDSFVFDSVFFQIVSVSKILANFTSLSSAFNSYDIHFGADYFSFYGKDMLTSADIILPQDRFHQYTSVNGTQVSNLEKLLLASFFVCHNDMHNENVGINLESSELMLVDYDAALGHECVMPKIYNLANYIDSLDYIINLDLQNIKTNIHYHLSRFPFDENMLNKTLEESFEKLRSKQSLFNQTLTEAKELQNCLYDIDSCGDVFGIISKLPDNDNFAGYSVDELKQEFALSA